MSVRKAALLFATSLLAVAVAYPAVAQECPPAPIWGNAYDIYIRLDRKPGESSSDWSNRLGEMGAWWAGIQEQGRRVYPGRLPCNTLNPIESRWDSLPNAQFVYPTKTKEVWLYCRDAAGKPLQRDGSWPPEVQVCEYRTGAATRPATTPSAPGQRPAAPRTATAPAAPAAPKPTVSEADALAAARLAEQRNAELAAQRAATDRLNAEVARADAETVVRNRAKEEQFAREQAEHRRQLAAVEAETARIRAENEAVQRAFAERRAAWEAQVAACNRGDRAACTGQTPAKPAGPRQAYWFVYAVGAEHVGYESAKMMTAAEVQAEEAMLTRLAPQRYGANVRVLRWAVPRSDMCSQLYLENPQDKTYGLKTGPRDLVEARVADHVRQWGGRPVSGVVCN